MGPKGSQKAAKGSQKAAKGCQKGAKGEPTGDQNASKSRPSEKVEKMMENGGGPASIIGSTFGDISLKNQ